MRGDVFLNQKESRRVFVMEQVLEGKLTNRQAAELLGLSERQIKRLKGGMRKEGVAALAHKNRGRKPAHTTPQAIRDRVVELVQTRYCGASYQHTAELLAEFDGITLSAKTVRRILSQAGLILNQHPKKHRRHRSRTRLPQEGLLVQCDASPFLWLEDRGPAMTLHGAIDDATGKILGLVFRPQEDLWGYLFLLDQILRHHGIPYSLYSDRHTIFFSPKKDKLSLEEELAGATAQLTQFGQALQDLDINHIPARSPQAKGRIERLWETLQQRLVVELRVAGISSLEQANRFLPRFIRKFNARFAVQPADPSTAFRPCPQPEALHRILTRREARQASQGSTISYCGHTYQLIDSRGRVVPLLPKSQVLVLTHLDYSHSALYNGRLYSLQELPSPARKEQVPNPPAPSPRPPHKPPKDHPWYQPTCRPKRKRTAIEKYCDPQDDQFWKDVYGT